MSSVLIFLIQLNYYYYCCFFFLDFWFCWIDFIESSNVFLTIEIFRERTCLAYHFQPGLALFIRSMILFNPHTWDKYFSLAGSNVGEISLCFHRDDILAYNCYSIFVLFPLIKQYEISSRFYKSKFQSGLNISI